MEQTKSTTIYVHPRFFVTFRHGSHRRFNMGDNLKLYHAEKKVDEQKKALMCVFEAYDFILLKSRSNVVDRKPSIANAEESIPFTLAGFGNDVGSLSYLPGGGIWGAKGLIGMNYGYTMMSWKNHQEAISEAAIFCAKNIIYPAVEFEKAYMEELEKERKEEGSPPN